MKTLSRLLKDYGAYHTKPPTFYTHLMGVPLVVFAIMILTSWISISVKPLFEISLVWFLIVGVGIYYFRLDWKIGLGIFIGFCAMAWLACAITADGINIFSGSIFCICFIVGWIIQLVGHKFEGRKPAFLDNFWQVLNAPLFIVVETLILLDFRKDLKPR